MERLGVDDTGTTSIEYALIALILAVGIIGDVQLLGTEVQSIFSFVASLVGEGVTTDRRSSPRS